MEHVLSMGLSEIILFLSHEALLILKDLVEVHEIKQRKFIEAFVHRDVFEHRVIFLELSLNREGQSFIVF